MKRTKKLVSLFLAVSFLLSLCSGLQGGVFAAGDTYSEQTDLTTGEAPRYASYDANPNDLKLLLSVEADCSEGLEFTLNSDGGSYAVSGIGSCTDTEIVIPDQYNGLPVTSIGGDAFSRCSSLTSITIPNSVTNIGGWAFGYCNSLASITLPNSVTSIGRSAFYDCSSLTSITIPNSVTSIEDNSFHNCTSLTSITIPNSVTSIGDDAFVLCTSLKTITLPNSVTSIGVGAFSSCRSLTSITLSNSVTRIGSNTFYYCDSLTSITIPNSVTSIGIYAFKECSSLTSITIPNSVTSIGDGTFYNCSNLMSITLPNSVMNIGRNTFDGCTSLMSITIPGSVNSIGYRAFADCTSLARVTISNADCFIADDAFYFANSDLVFFGRPDSTTEEYVAQHTTYRFMEIGSETDSDDDFVISNKTLLLYQGPGGAIEIPAGVEAIGAAAFQNSTTITSVKMNDELKSIGSKAFHGCTVLESVVLNAGLYTIGDDAFSDCTALRGDLEIPHSVTSIGVGAFDGCTGLDGKLTIGGNVDGITIGEAAFYGCSNIARLELKNGITNIGFRAFYRCGGLTGKLIIPDSVTSIGSEAFYLCSGLTGDLIIPDSVTSIGKSAFGYCRGFCGKLKLSENLTAINDYTFAYCSGIRGELLIPDNVTNITDGAFEHLILVTSIVFGEGLKTIAAGFNPFKDSGAKEIRFRGKTVPISIPENMFSSMNALETIYVPAESYDAYVDALDPYIDDAVISCNIFGATVHAFEATNRYSSTIALTWAPHISDDVIGYSLSRDGVEIARTTECGYVDTGLTSGEHTYSIYGFAADGTTTPPATLTTTTAAPELVKIYSKHLNNAIGATDGQVFISAMNEQNAFDLDGNEIKGRLYYLDAKGSRVFLGSSQLDMHSISLEKLIYSVNCDITNFAEGEYSVVFVLEDPDGAKAELESTINVVKTAPEKIINVIAVGDFTKIDLSWSQSSEVDSTIYRIYRKSEADSEFSQYKTIYGRTVLAYSDTAVDKDKTYSYYVVTENSFGVTSERSEIAAATLATDLEAPTVTKFAPANNSFITKQQKITVSAVDNLMPIKVRLYYSVDEGENWIFAGEDIASPFSFTVNTTAIADGKTTFRAYAYDAQGNESVPMNCVYHVDNTGPEKVTGLSAKTVLTSKVTLQWNDVADNDAASFILQQKNGSSYKTVASSITTLGYNLSNLYPGTAYTFRVAAVDVRGNVGTYSDDFTVTTDEDITPPVVTSLVPNPSRHNNSIDFKASAGDDCAIKSITIQASIDGVNWTDLSTANYTSYKKTATYAYTVSLANYSDCSIFIRAVANDYSGNTSDASPAAPFVEYIVDKTSPDKPRDLIASGGDGWIYVSWLQGEEEDLGTYQLYRSTSEDGPYSLIASNLKKISYYDNKAQRDTVYYYKLRVLDTTGNLSDFTDAVCAKVADDILPPEVVSINPASGSFIGPAYRTVEALVKDNNCIDSIVFEYKVNDAAEYTTLKEFRNIGYYYTTSRVDLPVDEFSDGDRIFVRVFATDIVGLTSEYSSEYIYLVDKVAPRLSNLSVTIEDDNARIAWQNAGDSDVSGYKVYRVNSDGTFTALGSRAYSSAKTYTFYDKIYTLGDGDYSYKIEAHDKVGNYNSFFTDPVHYEHEVVVPVNKAPTAVISGFETMEIGVEEFFDAGYSTDDHGIVTYLWDFGDGTNSNQVKPIKKYKQAGTFEVTLTVTDADGETSTAAITVTVKERTAVGTVKVNVVDENGDPVPDAPVYFDLGADGQKRINTDTDGSSSMLMENGDHEIGVYKSGYLPVQKTVTVLPNATRVVTMTIIKQEIVTGEFEVTRMTFGEIQSAGIDVYSPANQNVYKVEVTIKYGGAEIPIKYIRNDSEIISYSIEDSGGTISSGSSVIGVSGEKGSSSGERTISGISFIPNKENREIIAVLDMPVGASCLKEFFDVRLHIINNAAPEFRLVDNKVHLDIPQGLTLMSGISGDWYQTQDVSVDVINGQETRSLAWVLRGDEAGEYDLSADYSGTLAKFNEPVSTTFKTEEPIKVFGLKDFKIVLEANDEIAYNAFYFNIGLENNGIINQYNPQLDFDSIVSNITASAKKDIDGITAEVVDDFDIAPVLINVRFVNAAGKIRYIPFTVSDNKVITDIDMLAPGEAVYYEYAAYNMINYDGTAFFVDAATEQLSEYGGSFEVRNIAISAYNTAIAIDRFESGTLDQNALSYLTNNENYYYYTMAKKTENNTGILRVVYNIEKVIGEFDWDVLTGEDKKKLAESIVLQILVSQDAMENVEDLIDEAYVKAVRSYLSLLQSLIKDRKINYDKYFETVKYYKYSGTDRPIEDYGYAPMENGIPLIKDVETEGVVYKAGLANLDQWGKIIDGALGSYLTIDKLAKQLKNLGIEGFKNELLNEGAKAGLSIGMAYVNWTFRDMLSDKDIIGELSKTGKFTTKVLDFTVLNPIKAVNEAAYNQAIYNAIQANACIEEELFILDMILDYCDSSDSPFADVVKEVAQDYLEIAQRKAYDYQSDVIDQYTKFTLESVGTDVAKWATKGILTAISPTVFIVYSILSSTFSILDEKLKWGENFKCQDGLDITECLSTMFLRAWEDNRAEYMATKEYDSAMAATHALKYLTQTRLIGESLFKDYVDNINTDFVDTVNEELGTSYKNVEEFYDHIYGTALSARDTIFKDRPETPAVKPAAPRVTFNYDTMTTDEVFDDSYEYCLSNGEWIRCSGEKIAVTLKTNSTVLRVRAVSGGGNPAGEITTLNLYAQREFSKVVTVKYDNGKYYFNNLLSTYEYQICPLSSEYGTPDWTNSKTFRGAPDASVAFDYGKYLAIRTCANDSLKETASRVGVIPVQSRQTLSVNVWGNGEVTQSSDSGEYFVGDDITLTARPAAGAVFRGWYIGKELVGTDAKYILEMFRNAEITAKFEGGENVEAEHIDLVLANVTDKYVPQRNLMTVESVPSTKVYKESSAKLIANVYPLNAGNKSVTWESSDDTVATVDSFGSVSFIEPGNVTITASIENGESAAYDFNVIENAVTGIYIAEPASKTVYFEDEYLDISGLKLMAKCENGKTMEIRNYTISGYDFTVGEKSLTLTYEGFTAEYTVRVIHKPEWHTTTESSCVKAGSESEICAVCVQTLRTRELPLKAHEFEWVVTQPATSDTDGVKEYTCKVCGHVETSDILKWCDHSYSEVVKEPICEARGYTTFTCTKCGDSYVGDYVDALGHDYSESVIAPRCGKIGYTLHTCARCGDTYTGEYTEALEHSYVESVIAPTCIAEGYTEHRCEICEDVYMTDFTDKVSHNYSAEIVEATCEHEGYTLYTCEMCHDSFRAEEMPMLSHSFTSVEKNGNCTEGSCIVNTCTKCGHEETIVVAEPAEHSFGEWCVRKAADEGHAGTKYRTCANCGYEETAAIPITDHQHTAGDWYVKQEATCEMYGVKERACTECKEIIASEIIPAKGHDFDDTMTAPTCTQDGYTTHTCRNCRYSYQDEVKPALGHIDGEWVTVEEASCTEAGRRCKYCSTCGNVIEEETIEATGHVHTHWDVISEADCTSTGVEKLKCDDCGSYVDSRIIAPLGHKYAVTATEADCTNDGITTYKCSICGHSYTEVNEKAKGHDYGDWYVNKNATCVEKGVEQRDCTLCDAFETRETAYGAHIYYETVSAPTCTEKGYITHTCEYCSDSFVDGYTDALGHDYGSWYETKAPTCTEKGTEQRDCSRCDHFETREVVTIEHSYCGIVTSPTCTEAGYTTYTCSKCGDNYIADEVAPLGHDYADGVCTRCEEKDPNYVESNVVITVGDVQTMPGKTVTVPVSIAGNPGFAGFTFTITADEGLSLTKISKAGILSESESGAMTPNVAKGQVNWTNYSNDLGDGDLLLLTFNVDENAADGNYHVRLALKDGKDSNFVNEHERSIPACFVDGTVTVSSVVYGDLSGDEDITSSDCVMLARYLVGLQEFTWKQLTAADVNHDGDVTAADAVMLAKFIVGLIDSIEEPEDTMRVMSAAAPSIEGAVLEVGTVSGQKGDTVTVPVSIRGNSGFAGFTMEVLHDSDIRLKSVKKGELLKESDSGAFTANASKKLVNWTDSMDLCGDGVLMELTFELLETGAYEIGLETKDQKVSNFVNADGVIIEAELPGGDVIAMLNSFLDLPEADNWAYSGIDYCVRKGMMKGVSDELFNPSGTVTRAQLVTILYRLAGEPDAAYESTFTDVEAGKWYTDAVAWASKNGIINGVGNGRFAPDAPITREQIATILYRYTGSPKTEADLDVFPDSDTVSTYAVDSMKWAVAEGLINGLKSSETTFLSPKATATRAQIAAIIMRFLDEK